MKKLPTLIVSSIIGAGLITSSAFATDATFTVSSQIINNIALTNQQGITFPTQEVVSGDTPITVGPTDAAAAIFSAIGEAGKNATGSVTDTNIQLSCTSAATCGTDAITVNNFTLGGDLAAGGRVTFPGALGSGTGNLTNLRIGATETLTSADRAGTYSGTATFRLVYVS